MGRMKDLDERLTYQDEMLDCLGTRYENLQHQMDQMLHLLADMVKMEDQIKKMEENIERRLSRMEAAQVDSSKLVDRLIEMSLVRSGQPDQAVLHRAQSRLEQTHFSDPQSWAGDGEEDVWPPPGCDAMESRG